MNEVEEVIKELKTNPGFSAYVIMNNDGECAKKQGGKDGRLAGTATSGVAETNRGRGERKSIKHNSICRFKLTVMS